MRISLKINVKHINLAPWVNVAQPNWTSTATKPVLITGVSMNDTDASFYQESFTLSLRYHTLSPPLSPPTSRSLFYFSNIF